MSQVAPIENLPLEGTLRDSHLQVLVLNQYTDIQLYHLLINAGARSSVSLVSSLRMVGLSSSGLPFPALRGILFPFCTFFNSVQVVSRPVSCILYFHLFSGGLPSSAL